MAGQNTPSRQPNPPVDRHGMKQAELASMLLAASGAAITTAVAHSAEDIKTALFYSPRDFSVVSPKTLAFFVVVETPLCALRKHRALKRMAVDILADFRTFLFWTLVLLGLYSTIF
ncbi:MAG: uncharacterized protein A8A55_0562 [Amphiamblys sp. WSBS2006]|nr:MAG: uncharacterized protein A8A55_0562 [Amphiamblys sp. WSBS2006]